MQQIRSRIHRALAAGLAKPSLLGRSASDGAMAGSCMQAKRTLSSRKIEIFSKVCRNAYSASIASDSPLYDHVSAGFGKSIFEITSGDNSDSIGTHVHFVQPADLLPGPSSVLPRTLIDFLMEQKDCVMFSADKIGSTITLHNPFGDKKNIVLVALGNLEKPIRYSQFEKAITALSAEIETRKWRQVAIHVYPREGQVNHFSCPKDLAKSLKTASYKFDILKEIKTGDSAEQEGEDAIIKSTITIVSLAEPAQTVEEGIGIAVGQNYARTLKNLPANICCTDYMRKEMEGLLEHAGFSDFQCIGEQEMSRLGMGCFTAVGVGSSMPSYFCKIEWNKDKAKEGHPTIVLLGKGVVHDSGGLCIKPGNTMPGMKMDMGGAASVLGTLKAIAELHLPIHVVGAIGLVENSISSKAFRPGDILKSMDGLTVEVGNTDAEGRLVLCDCLTWIEKKYASSENGSSTSSSRSKPVVIDVATLTGACIVALGGELTGGYSNCPDLLEELEKAGKNANDRLWKMPLLEVEDEYLEQMKSDGADINNIGGPAGGSITAALFLSKFAKNLRWAHLDIAGTAMGGSLDKPKATGRPVPLLVEYLKSICGTRS